MFQEVKDADFVRGEHSVLKFWQDQAIFQKLRDQNAGKPRWSFLDGPITANNPMGVHHAWGRTYKDTYQRFFAMMGYDQRYQNGFDCQGLWVEVEVEKQLGLGTKTAIAEFGIDKFVNECKRRVLTFAARQTEQSVRLGYWMDWDDPDQLRTLAEKVGTDEPVDFTAPNGTQESAPAHQIVERLGNPDWGGSYFTFSTENNETIWTFLKKCFTRGKVYQGHDVDLNHDVALKVLRPEYAEHAEVVERFLAEAHLERAQQRTQNITADQVYTRDIAQNDGGLPRT